MSKTTKTILNFLIFVAWFAMFSMLISTVAYFGGFCVDIVHISKQGLSQNTGFALFSSFINLVSSILLIFIYNCLRRFSNSVKKISFFNAYNIIQLKSFLIYTGSCLAIELVFFFVSGIHEQYPFGPALGNALLSIALPTVFWAFSYLVYVAFKYGFNLQEDVDEVI